MSVVAVLLKKKLTEHGGRCRRRTVRRTLTAARAAARGRDCAVFAPESEQIRFFFLQAEDGIREGRVTGVQTCALPILGMCSDCGRSIPRVSATTAPAGRPR